MNQIIQSLYNLKDGGLESVNLHSGEVGIYPVTKDTPCGEFDTTVFNFATMICASNDPAATIREIF